MKRILAFFTDCWRRLNWSTNYGTWLEMVLIMAVVPAMRWGNPQWFVEDGLIENMQLLVLAAGLVVAFKATENRPLFVLAAFVVMFMIIRETNLFRGWFCEKYLSADELCKWSAFRYGWIADAVRWLFVGYIAYYAWRKRLWRLLGDYVQKAPIYVWDIAILGLMMVGGTVAEFACVDNEIMEEECELIAYVALVNCIYRYRIWKV